MGIVPHVGVLGLVLGVVGHGGVVVVEVAVFGVVDLGEVPNPLGDGGLSRAGQAKQAWIELGTETQI